MRDSRPFDAAPYTAPCQNTVTIIDRILPQCANNVENARAIPEISPGAPGWQGLDQKVPQCCRIYWTTVLNIIMSVTDAGGVMALRGREPHAKIG